MAKYSTYVSLRLLSGDGDKSGKDDDDGMMVGIDIGMGSSIDMVLLGIGGIVIW